MATKNTLESILARTKKLPNGCWEWQGRLLWAGYGSVGWKGKNCRVHRVVYEEMVGTIPKGLVVCHTCDNPRCCNPSHLWIGTMLQNTRDKISKGRQAVGTRLPNAILDEEKVKQIKKAKASGKFFWGRRKLARQFGVSAQTISDVANGIYWKQVKL